MVKLKKNQFYKITKNKKRIKLEVITYHKLKLKDEIKNKLKFYKQTNNKN
jgi:hypothetical protein